MFRIIRSARWLIAMFAVLLITACGSDDGSVTPPGVNQTLTIQITGSGTVVSQPEGLNCSANCSAEFAGGTQVTLTSSPSAGSAFTGWSGACSGAATTCTVSLDQAQSVTATFTRSQGSSSYSMTVSVSGNGKIASQPSGIDCGSLCNATFASATRVTLTATPSTGQAFTRWTGDCAGTSTTCTLEMGSNRAVQAVFSAQQAAGWTDQLMVSAAASDKHGFPRTVMAADGTALATWFQQLDDGSGTITGYAMFSNRYIPGSGWSASSEITRVGPTATNNPYRLVMNSAGKGVLVWTELKTGETTKFNVLGKPFDLATGWGANSVISSATLVDQTGNLDAGVDNNGNAVVTWIQINPSGPSLRAVWANRYAISSGWGTAQMLNDTQDDGATNPTVAVLSNGDALAVWRGFSNFSGFNVRKYTAGGTWGPVSLLVQRTASGNTRYDVGLVPAIAADKNGGAMLVWWQTNLLSGPSRFESAMWSQRYTAGAWAATPVTISAVATGTPPSSSNQVKAVINFNTQNRAAVAWIPNALSTQVFVNRSRTDGTWETELTANTVSSREVSEVNVGIDDLGNVTAAWYGSQQSNNMTNRFTEGSGWGTPEARAVYDNTRGILAATQFAHNARGDVALVYQLNTNIVAQGSQIFSRYFRAQ